MTVAAGRSSGKAEARRRGCAERERQTDGVGFMHGRGAVRAEARRWRAGGAGASCERHGALADGTGSTCGRGADRAEVRRRRAGGTGAAMAGRAGGAPTGEWHARCCGRLVVCPRL